MGCGSGRWAKLISPKVKLLNCIEPSNAIEIAKKIFIQIMLFLSKNRYLIIFYHLIPQDFGIH